MSAGNKQSAETQGADAGGDRPSLKGRGYHHGRLREALLIAARTLVSERGPAGFTLAEAAKMVGVTGAAPYRHFADRQALLNALARQGFENFNERLGAAWDHGQPDPVTALTRRGKAYLDFVKAEPGLYRAMFGDAAALVDPACDGPAKKACEELVNTTAQILAFFGASSVDAYFVGMQIWATTHGVAELMLGGHFGDIGVDPLALVQASAGALIEGAVRQAKGAAPV